MSNFDLELPFELPFFIETLQHIRNYLNTFIEIPMSNSDLELPFFIETLQHIPDFQLSSSQLECLTYVAGYAVFSYINKSNKCLNCNNF